jgi:hypothetical protein
VAAATLTTRRLSRSRVAQSSLFSSLYSRAYLLFSDWTLFNELLAAARLLRHTTTITKLRTPSLAAMRKVELSSVQYTITQLAPPCSLCAKFKLCLQVSLIFKRRGKGSAQISEGFCRCGVRRLPRGDFHKQLYLGSNALSTPRAHRRSCAFAFLDCSQEKRVKKRT